MKESIKKAVIISTYLIKSIRLVPCLSVVLFSKNNKIIMLDSCRWTEIFLETKSENKLKDLLNFVYLLIRLPEFRSLVYHRLGFAGYVLKYIYPPLSSLYIYTQDIGEGLYIQHGFATGIGAEKIGKNCWINQQVSIGYKGKYDCPILGDNVMVCAGAKILGKVKVGDNSIIGANAVVVKDVPPNCTVVGVPAYIIKRDGKEVHEDL